jgi:hypothetical protein
MMAMVVVTFFRNDEPVIRPALKPALGKATAVLVGFMPLLSFFDRWDDYLSASLYSGRTKDGWIMLNEEAANRFKNSLTRAEQARLKDAFDGYSLDVTTWSMKELNVPLYPEQRVYEGVAKKLRRFATTAEDVTLLVTERPSLFGEPVESTDEVSLR